MLRHILGGLFAGLFGLSAWVCLYAAILALLGSCSSPSLLQCRVDAVSRLPLRVVEDPDTLTVGDVRALAEELRACRVPGDAGP